MSVLFRPRLLRQKLFPRTQEMEPSSQEPTWRNDVIQKNSRISLKKDSTSMTRSPNACKTYVQQSNSLFAFEQSTLLMLPPDQLYLKSEISQFVAIQLGHFEPEDRSAFVLVCIFRIYSLYLEMLSNPKSKVGFTQTALVIHGNWRANFGVVRRGFFSLAKIFCLNC